MAQTFTGWFTAALTHKHSKLIILDPASWGFCALQVPKIVVTAATNSAKHVAHVICIDAAVRVWAAKRLTRT